jgi:hypothetical protein
MYSKYGHPILIYQPTGQPNLYDSGVILMMMRYINSDYYETKALDKTEVGRDRSFWEIIKTVGPKDPIVKDAVYISREDLSKTNKKFSDFALVGLWREYNGKQMFYILVNKDRL